jgi:GNAT superfamily N-acetyltransferase
LASPAAQFERMPDSAALPALRLARAEDVPALAELIALSARGLAVGAEDYSAEQVEAALRGAFGVDTGLIADGTYYLAEHDGRPVACGGWSRRRALFGGDSYHGASEELLDPAVEPARIRAFFVHPDWARRGLGRALLDRCEAAAKASNFRTVTLMATRPGVRLYRAAGYVADAPVVFDLGGVKIDFIPMSKSLA